MPIENKTAEEKQFNRTTNRKGGQVMGFDKGAYWGQRKDEIKVSITKEMKKAFAFVGFINGLFERDPIPALPFTLTAAQRSNYKRIATPKRKLIHSRSLADRLVRRQKHASMIRNHA
jgi:hypothetical protein